MCSGITRGRMLNRELYAQTIQKLIHLHLFHEDFSAITGTNTVAAVDTATVFVPTVERNLHETVCN